MNHSDVLPRISGAGRLNLPAFFCVVGDGMGGVEGGICLNLLKWSGIPVNGMRG
jgi:hypothetical protein